MHARLSTYQGPAGLTDAQIEQINEELQERVMPKIRSMAGFKGLFSLYDDTTGKSVSITLWESKDAMTASEADANTIRDEASDIAQEQTMSVEGYRVTLMETV
jgi:heme-degrading monooxygenase HmoA